MTDRDQLLAATRRQLKSAQHPGLTCLEVHVRCRSWQRGLWWGVILTGGASLVMILAALLGGC
jgi:hypothetical protein